MTMEQKQAKRIAQTAEMLLPIAGDFCCNARHERIEVPYVLVTAAVMAICKIRENETMLSAQIAPLAQYVTDSLVISLRKNGFVIDVPVDTAGKIIGSSKVLIN